MNIERALAIEGWMGKTELQWLAEQASHAHWILEVGCWRGRSTAAMADNTEGLIVAVDTFLGSPEHAGELEQHPAGWLFEQFRRNQMGCRVLTIAADSIQANEYLGRWMVKFDFIFLDAAHDYQSVKGDILRWHPLLAPCGLLSGHDFIGDYPGVAQAVREILPNCEVVPGTSIWRTI